MSAGLWILRFFGYFFAIDVGVNLVLENVIANQLQNSLSFLLGVLILSAAAAAKAAS